MSLVELCDNTLTDKNTRHSYLDLYEELFRSKKDSAKNILEVGIGQTPQQNGGSIKLWADYFKNAKIYGLDILPIETVYSPLITHPRIYLYTTCDAYNTKFFMNHISSKKLRFDIVLDDGPHTQESMIKFIKLYSTVLEDDGILVIEDVLDINWIEVLTAVTPEHLQPYIEVYDRRHIKGCYDDIVFVINKNRQH